jgi:hypothetical protein
MTKLQKEGLQNTTFSILLLIVIYSIVWYLLSPKFKVGDCFQYKYNESWEKGNYISKVLSVGKKHYFTTFTMQGHTFNSNPYESGLTEEDRIDFTDAEYEKVKCP